MWIGEHENSTLKICGFNRIRAANLPDPPIVVHNGLGSVFQGIVSGHSGNEKRSGTVKPPELSFHF
jgi:hypothetical protein